MLKIFLVGLSICSTVSGCTSYAVGVPSSQGKAYVIRSQGWSQDMVLCDATTGRPICTVQKEEAK